MGTLESSKKTINYELIEKNNKKLKLTAKRWTKIFSKINGRSVSLILRNFKRCRRTKY
jgi:hypothetical protein